MTSQSQPYGAFDNFASAPAYTVQQGQGKFGRKHSRGTSFSHEFAFPLNSHSLDRDQLNSFTLPNGSRPKDRNQTIKLQSLGNVKSSTDDFKVWKVLYYSPIAASTSRGDFSSTLRQGLLSVKDVERQEKSQKQERELIRAVNKTLEASWLQVIDVQTERISLPTLTPPSPRHESPEQVRPSLKEKFHGVEVERGQPSINMALRNMNVNEVDLLDPPPHPSQATPSSGLPDQEFHLESEEDGGPYPSLPQSCSPVPSTTSPVPSTNADLETGAPSEISFHTDKHEETDAVEVEKGSGKIHKAPPSKGRAMLGSPVGQLMGPRSGAGRRQGIMQTQSNVVQHLQRYRRSRTPTPTNNHKWRRQQKQKARAKSQWEYKAGVYMEGTLDEIIREGLIKDDRVETRVGEHRLPSRQQLLLNETENVPNEHSSIMNYFGAQPFDGDDDGGQKQNSGWDLSNPFSGNSTLGESRKIHEYIQDAVASNWTMKKIEVALRPLRHPNGWNPHVDD
ncbi:hypothetical protein BSKO_07561 [Bryopsis sp. KO-2023]|nr:hypothetical protein BSKO_07561 [Bryopsis sp. KO-2023]